MDEKHQTSSKELKEKRARGVIYGMFVGDALGASHEFKDIQYPPPKTYQVIFSPSAKDTIVDIGKIAIFKSGSEFYYKIRGQFFIFVLDNEEENFLNDHVKNLKDGEILSTTNTSTPELNNKLKSIIDKLFFQAANTRLILSEEERKNGLKIQGGGGHFHQIPLVAAKVMPNLKTLRKFYRNRYIFVNTDSKLHYIDLNGNSVKEFPISSAMKGKLFSIKNASDEAIENFIKNELEKELNTIIPNIPANYNLLLKITDGSHFFEGENFSLKPGQWTDDASQGACLIKALMTISAPNQNGKTRQFPSAIFMQNVYAWNKEGYYSGLGSEEYNYTSVGLGGVVSIAITNWKTKHESQSAEQLAHANLPNSLASAIKVGTLCDGNGSTMRYGGCAIFGSNIEESMAFAYEQSIVTTKGPESADCARLLAYLTYQAIHSSKQDPHELKAFLLSDENLKDFERLANEQILPSHNSNYLRREKVPLNEKVALMCHPENAKGENIFINWKVSQANYKLNPAQTNLNYYGAYATEGLALVLNAFYNTNSFEELVGTIASAKGDADSNAAIAGQLGGAVYSSDSIPQRWLECVNQHPLNPRKINHSDPNETLCSFADNVIEKVRPLLTEPVPITKTSENQPLTESVVMSLQMDTKDANQSINAPNISESFTSKYRIWLGVNAALIVLTGIALIALAVFPPTAVVILGASLSGLALAGMAGGTAFLLWNAACFIKKFFCADDGGEPSRQQDDLANSEKTVVFNNSNQQNNKNPKSKDIFYNAITETKDSPEQNPEASNNTPDL